MIQQNPAVGSSIKTLVSCQSNQQSPPLSANCNIVIIKVSKQLFATSCPVAKQFRALISHSEFRSSRLPHKRENAPDFRTQLPKPSQHRWIWAHRPVNR